MPFPSTRLTIGLIAAVCITLLIAGVGGWLWSQRERQPQAAQSLAETPVEAPRSDYLGSAACAECHPRIAEAYRSHPMSRSMGHVDSTPPLEDFSDSAAFSPDGRHHYRVEKTDSGIVHHEKLNDADGELLYDQGVRVEYAIGSGTHGKSYAIHRDGQMFMSPISWYSRAGAWGLSPGYRLPQHRRFDRRIKDACLDCHAGRLNKEGQAENCLGNPPFLELSIGCERCHGPGGEHARLHRDVTIEVAADPIINPARLDPARREDICAQCHLQGRGRIPNPGHSVGDFRPGQRLEETCVIFVDGTRIGEKGSRVVSQVEQMRASACYRKSAGRFGCTSCHDPHSLPDETTRVQFYRERCLQCHQDHGCSLPESDRLTRQSDDSCFSCHMPRLNASDVPHLSQTDHRVPRLPSPADQADEAPAEFPEIFDNADQRLPELIVNRARGLWLSEMAELNTDRLRAAQATLLLSTVLQELPEDPAVLEGLGTAAAVDGRLDDALAHWKKGLLVDPERESTLRLVALSLQNTRQNELALPYLETYLRVQPWNASMWGRYSQLLARSGRREQALDAALKSNELDPSIPRTYHWLSELYRQSGDEERAQRYEELSQRLLKELSP